LVLRTDLGGGPSYRELLRRVREVTLGGYANQDVPFEKVVEEMRPERELGKTPLFEVTFVLQNAPVGELKLPGLVLSFIETKNKIAKFDLSLTFGEIEGGLSGAFQYSTDLFDESTIKRMANHYKALLETAVANPDQSIIDLEMLSLHEEHQLLIEWNDTADTSWHDLSFQQAFQGQVDRSPDALAVSSTHHQLTYAQLNAKANLVANFLRSRGVRAEYVVAILARRGVDFIAAVLGVWKVGAAYLPLDPYHPAGRHQQVIEQSGVKLVLTGSDYCEATREVIAGMRREGVVEVAELEQMLERGGPQTASAGEEVWHFSSGRELAYVIYTSGSTGVPKGVMVEHRGMMNHLMAKVKELEITSADKIAQTASQCFDISVWQFASALLVGGTVRVVDDEVARDANELMKEVSNQGVTILESVPSLLNNLLQESNKGFRGLSGLRWMIATGEALMAQTSREWNRVYEGVRLVNAYGPTECSDDVTHHIVEGEIREWEVRTPIGKAIANTRLYILDRRMRPVGIGIEGELYVGGVAVGRGYYNDACKTAEAFLPDEYGGEAGGRLYRTGDRVRYRAAGRIEFIGRVDEQMKLRGYRIELGEIRAAVTLQAGVRDAVVDVREKEAVKRLVAYVVMEEGGSIEDVKRGVEQRLPGYMVPSAFVILDRLPLTPNGKIDRKSLPPPDRMDVKSSGGYVGPRDALELQLSRIWEDVLGIAPVGVRDDFFELGGHSLLSILLINRVKNSFDVDLPVATLFRRSTVESLAAEIRRQADVPNRSTSLVEIQPGRAELPFFCVHPAGGSVFCYVDLARQLGADQAFYGFQSRGVNNNESLDLRIEDMAAHYLGSLREVQPQGPYLLGGWSIGGLIAFEMAQQLRAEGEQIALLALLDTVAPTRYAAPEAWGSLSLLATFAQDMGLTLEQLAISEDDLVQLNPHEQLRHVLERAQSFGILPPDFNQPLIQRFFEVFVTNVDAASRYVPKTTSGRPSLFRAIERPVLNTGDEAYGWDELLSDELEVHSVPGGHFTMLRRPNVRVLAEHLKACIEAAIESIHTP
ncbi:MAG: non-ribosomal peptide synthetase, partial [Blastocatellia bacterium]